MYEEFSPSTSSILQVFRYEYEGHSDKWQGPPPELAGAGRFSLDDYVRCLRECRQDGLPYSAPLFDLDKDMAFHFRDAAEESKLIDRLGDGLGNTYIFTLVPMCASFVKTRSCEIILGENESVLRTTGGQLPTHRYLPLEIVEQCSADISAFGHAEHFGLIGSVDEAIAYRDLHVAYMLALRRIMLANVRLVDGEISTLEEREIERTFQKILNEMNANLRSALVSNRVARQIINRLEQEMPLCGR